MLTAANAAENSKGDKWESWPELTAANAAENFNRA